MKKYQGKALWTTDYHLEEKKTLFYKQKFFPFILKTAIEQGCTIIINSGDTFHNHNELLGTELGLYQEFLNQCYALGIEVITIVGNHDLCKPKKTQGDKVFDYLHSLEGFKGQLGHLVIDEPTLIEINGQVIGLTPYCRTEAHYNEMFNVFKGKTKTIIGHFDCNGFKYTPESGEIVDRWCTEEHFVEFDAIFSGHYHQHQQKALSHGNTMTYLGTQYTTNHGQTNQEKFIGVLDFGKNEYKYLKTPFTLHKTIQVKASEDLPKVSAEDKENGVDVRLRIVGTAEEIKGIKIPREFMGKTSHKIVDKKEKRLDISCTDNKADSFKKYMEHVFKTRYGGVDKAPLDSERLLNMAARLLKT